MESNFDKISDTAAQSLVAAGHNLVSCGERFHLDDKTFEPVALAIDEDGQPIVHGSATQQLRKAQLQPKVARQSLRLSRVEDLALFVGRFKLSGTVVFAVSPLSQTARTATASSGFTAVIDYSENSGALGWNRHRAFVPCLLSKEAAAFGKSYSQDAFADLIDQWAGKVVPLENVKEAVDATAANLLQMANDLEIEESRVLKVTRDPKTRLFKAQMKDGAEAKTTIYPRFGVRLPVIEGRPERNVEIRLKLVKNGGEYQFSLCIHDLDRLVGEEFASMAKELADSAQVPVWQGAPPEEMGVGI